MFKKEITKKDVFKNNYLDIKIDPVFKGVFTSKSKESEEALKSIIGAYTDQKVTETLILQNEFAIINEAEKQIRLDIYCSFNNGQKAIIEMALTRRKDELIRSEYYTSKVFSSQDTKGVRDYRNIDPVYNITLIDKGRRFEEDNEPVHELEYYDPKRKVSLNGKTHIIIVEFDKIKSIKDIKPTNKKDQLLVKDIKSMNKKERWAAFLNWVNNDNKQEEIEELINLEGGIEMAERALKYISKDESMVYKAIRSEMHKLDWETQRNLDRDEGKEEGLREGEPKGRSKMAIEIAKTLLRLGKLSSGDISASTGLSIQEIENLNKGNK